MLRCSCEAATTVLRPDHAGSTRDGRTRFWLAAGTAVLLLLPGARITGRAAAPGDVVINEIAWGGTAASSTDEWIEFHNTTPEPIDIEGWSIFGADTGATLHFSSADGHSTWTIPARGYLIYANHSDDVTDADGKDLVDIWDATIGMNNTAPGQLILYDEAGTVIDLANGAAGDWFAGSSTPTYTTMERVDPLAPGDAAENWRSNDPTIVRTRFDADGSPVNGTPKARNSATNGAPIADAGEDRTVLVGDAVGLDGSASTDPDGDSLSYSWTFDSRPAGSTAIVSDANASRATFTADVPGTYAVKLVITDAYRGTATDRVAITAHAPPHAAFHYTPATPTVWDDIGLVDQSTDADGIITAWFWRIGDGATSHDPNPEHRFWDPGTYVIVLEVTDNDGLADAVTRTIQVRLGPGDLDADGALTTLDAHVCHQIAAGTVAPTAASRAQADIDGDGDVDLDDARALARFLIRR